MEIGNGITLVERVFTHKCNELPEHHYIDGKNNRWDKVNKVIIRWHVWESAHATSTQNIQSCPFCGIILFKEID